MYPYETYSMGEGMMVYNHDGSLENEIYCIVDKMVNKTLTTYDKRLIDILYTEYENDSIGCIEVTDKIIVNCLSESKYQHIKILCEYVDYTRKNFNAYF
jgi:hypothetical protein